MEEWTRRSQAILGSYGWDSESRTYPDYRFQPRKKEDKEREKAEAKKRREEERQAKRTLGRTVDTRASTIPPVPSVLPFPYSPYYDPHVRYGPAGPSPLLSCASSPRDDSSYCDTQSPQAEPLDSIFPPSQDANPAGLNALSPSNLSPLPQSENTQFPVSNQSGQSICPSQTLLSQCAQQTHTSRFPNPNAWTAGHYRFMEQSVGPKSHFSAVFQRQFRGNCKFF
jgi:hypothetical protein